MSLKRRIFEQFVFDQQKGGGNRPVINLMDLNRLIACKHFQDGRFALSEVGVAKKGITCAN